MNDRAIPGEECDCGPWVLVSPDRAETERQPHQFVQTFTAGTTTDWRCRFCLRWAGQI